jgi:integrase
MAERRKRLREARQTPPTKQMRDRDATAVRAYADRWSASEYRQHVERACARAGVPRFTPHEVRHAAITFAANHVGLTAAAAAANHTRTSTTSGYVHKRADEALAVAAAVEARVTAG